MDADRLKLMSVRETANVLGCSTKSVYRLLDGGRLTPLRPFSPGRPKGHLRVRADEVEALIAASREGS
jgi:excisionase family DNA binding protein